MKLQIPGGGVDALFLVLFLSALALTFVVALWLAAAVTEAGEIGAIRAETLVVAVLHAIVAARWLQAAKYAKSQRARELPAFEAALKP